MCEHMHWDYHTYMAQPLWFLYLVEKKMEIDSKKQKQEAERAKAKSRR